MFTIITIPSAFLCNLDINATQRSGVGVPRSSTDHVVAIAILDLEVVALGAPRAVPVDVAYLLIVLVQIEAALCSGRGVGTAAGTNAGFCLGCNDYSIDCTGRQFVVLVFILVEFSPVASKVNFVN